MSASARLAREHAREVAAGAESGNRPPDEVERVFGEEQSVVASVEQQQDAGAERLDPACGSSGVSSSYVVVAFGRAEGPWSSSGIS